MTQLTFIAVGVALGLFYTVALRRRRLHALSAVIAGAFGAWGGALTLAAAARSGWAIWGPSAIVGAVLGGAGTLVVLDLFVAYTRRREADEPPMTHADLAWSAADAVPEASAASHPDLPRAAASSASPPPSPGAPLPTSSATLPAAPPRDGSARATANGARPRRTSGPRRISEQVVVVTGASSGVGRAIARAFGAAGAKVALIARTTEALEHCAAEIRSAGGEALVLPLDVADAEAVERAADAVVARWGRIDTWVNDAMVSVFSPVKEMKASEYRRVTEVDYLGFVHGTLAALKHMLPRDEGHVIQVGSALVYRSIPLQSAYCASKAAIRGFTDSLRCELFHDRSHVRISMLQLPAVNTPQFDVVRSRLPRHPQPVPPIYQPEVIANAALYVAEHPTRELWIGWSTWKAIVGQKVIPGLLDRYLGRMGYSAQQTGQPVRPDRPDNVDAPIPGDKGAHGDFDARSRAISSELWLRRHRTALATAAAAVAAGTALWRRAFA